MTPSKETMGPRKPPPPAKTAALPPDWPWIKRQYRIGMKSAREIARESTAKGRKISHVAIEKRAHKEGWERDLKAAVKAAIADNLATGAVNNGDGSVNNDVPDAEIVEAAAIQGADIIRSHRTDIAKRRRISGDLLGQLDEVTSDAAGLVALVDSARPPQDATSKEKESFQQRRDRLMKMIGLAERVGVFKDLVQADGKLIALERQAFGLGEGEATGESIEDRLARIEGK